jgi:hypothetical protein
MASSFDVSGVVVIGNVVGVVVVGVVVVGGVGILTPLKLISILLL